MTSSNDYTDITLVLFDVLQYSLDACLYEEIWRS